MLHPVIMAGGSGTRFWPASTAASPKQLLNLVGELTMIQATVQRLDGLARNEDIQIITNRKLVDAIAQQLPQLPPEAIVGEPCKRDTAPCIGLSAALLMQNDPDATMAVMPADHVIQPTETFQKAIQFAADLVEEDRERLVTFGIRPTYPAESFGYIERGEAMASDAVVRGGLHAYEVQQFREKPDAATAEKYLQAGSFYWNAGIFVWKAQRVLDALARHAPDIHGQIAKIQAALGTDEYPAVLDREFGAIQGRSIDYAVMEQAEKVVVVEAPFEWDDVGSWQSLTRLQGRDETGNTVVGKHLGIDTSASIIRSEGDHLIVTLGVENLIVVHTPQATLVANRDQEEQVRAVVQELKGRNWLEYL